MISRTLLRALRLTPRRHFANLLPILGCSAPKHRFSANKFSDSKMEHSEKKEFKAETKKLLDIVAKSLYTDQEVFLRELLSNASDALEKQRFSSQSMDGLKVSVELSETKKQIIIQDNGVGMSKQELIDNLGTIAKSGSKEFVEALQKESAGGAPENIIGQFGVGFYSSFIVADYVQVISKTEKSDQAHIWSSDGSGVYEIGDAAHPGFERGTRITIHLKPDCDRFCSAKEAKSIIQKYSNFINYPISVNGQQLNLVKAIWARDKREVAQEEYQKFYEYLTGRKQEYLTKLHYSADVPLSIKALVYVPKTHVEKFGMASERGEVSLYSRKVLIKKDCRELIPHYLRFLKGVVDCEDIPLNISRESYQDSALMAKLRNVVTKRVIRQLKEEAEKSPEAYNTWYHDFEFFIKEGCLDQDNKKDLFELSRFECNLKEGWVSLKDYLSLRKEGQDKLFYMFSPSKQVSKLSPFLEPYNKACVPVLITHTHIDEAIFRESPEYEGLKFVNIETTDEDLSKYMPEMKHDESRGIKAEDLTSFPIWMKSELQPFVSKVVVSRKNITSPGLVISPVSTSMRQMRAMMKIADKNLDGMPEEDMRDLTFEVNPNHPLMAQLNQLRKKDVDTATIVLRQIFDNCCIEAGISGNPKQTINRLYNILSMLMKDETPQNQHQQEDQAYRK